MWTIWKQGLEWPWQGSIRRIIVSDEVKWKQNGSTSPTESDIGAWIGISPWHPGRSHCQPQTRQGEGVGQPLYVCINVGGRDWFELQKIYECTTVNTLIHNKSPCLRYANMHNQCQIRGTKKLADLGTGDEVINIFPLSSTALTRALSVIVFSVIVFLASFPVSVIIFFSHHFFGEFSSVSLFFTQIMPQCQNSHSRSQQINR